jgi:hypothetical protein
MTTTKEEFKKHGTTGISDSMVSHDFLDNGCFELDLSDTETSPESTKIKQSRNAEGSEEKDIFLKEFDRFLFEAIEDALTSLGGPVKNAVYQHLQDDFGIERSMLPGQIDKLSDIIHRIFGLGASRLEIKFMKNLNEKIEVNLRWPEFDYSESKWLIQDMSFFEYVSEARRSYVQSRKKQ